MTDTMSDGDYSAWAQDTIRQLLRNYGLEELTDWAMKLLDEGAPPSKVEYELENQPAFKRRFPAIEQRRQAGLPPVSVNQILDFERQVSELESYYGYPSGTLGDPQGHMVRDVSYNELQAAVAEEQAFLLSDPETQATMQRFYGVGATQGEVIGAVINSNVGLPVLQQRIQAANVGAESVVAGFGQLTRDEAERLVERGVNEQAAAEAFSLLARSTQLTSNFTRDQLLSLAAGEAPAVQQYELSRDTALSQFGGGGNYASLTRGLGAAE